MMTKQTFNKTLDGVLAYWTHWNVQRTNMYADGEEVMLYVKDKELNKIKEPLIKFAFPKNSANEKAVVGIQIMEYANEEDMVAFGSLASSLFTEDGVDMIVVQFEEEFAKSKKATYRVSEKYVPANMTSRMRAPFHFARAFEEGLLKRAGSIQAYSPKHTKPLSDGDGFFVIYAREEPVANKLTDLINYAWERDEMKTVPNRQSETANDIITKRTEFTHMAGKAKLLWESPAFAIELELGTLQCRVEDKKGGMFA